MAPPSFCMCCHKNLQFAGPNRKTPLTYVLSKELNKNALDKIHFVKDEYCTLFSCTTNPRCHLVFTGTNPCTLQDTCISQATDVCLHVAEYSVKPHLTAPSAVHLTTCFLPDFQHRRLSVKASLPLSPLQRFIITIYIFI